jgi:hypothetical protein
MSTNNNQIKTILRDRTYVKKESGWYKLIKGIQSDGVAYIDTLSLVHHLYHYQIIDLYHLPVTNAQVAYRICGFANNCFTQCSFFNATSVMPNTLSGPAGNATRNATIVANRPWYNRHIIMTEGYNGGIYGGWFSLYDVDQGNTYFPNGIDNIARYTTSSGTSKLFAMGTGTGQLISPIDPYVIIYEYQLFNGTNATDFMTEKVHLYPCILTQNIDSSLDSNNTARLKGTVGMYDSVSGKFFANRAASGSFIAILS